MNDGKDIHVHDSDVGIIYRDVMALHKKSLIVCLVLRVMHAKFVRKFLVSRKQEGYIFMWIIAMLLAKFVVCYALAVIHL